MSKTEKIVLVGGAIGAVVIIAMIMKNKSALTPAQQAALNAQRAIAASNAATAAANAAAANSTAATIAAGASAAGSLVNTISDIFGGSDTSNDMQSDYYGSDAFVSSGDGISGTRRGMVYVR